MDVNDKSVERLLPAKAFGHDKYMIAFSNGYSASDMLNAALVYCFLG